MWWCCLLPSDPSIFFATGAPGLGPGAGGADVAIGAAAATTPLQARHYDRLAVNYSGAATADTNYPVDEELLRAMGPRVRCRGGLRQQHQLKVDLIAPGSIALGPRLRIESLRHSHACLIGLGPGA